MRETHRPFPRILQDIIGTAVKVKSWSSSPSCLSSTNPTVRMDLSDNKTVSVPTFPTLHVSLDLSFPSPSFLPRKIFFFFFVTGELMDFGVRTYNLRFTNLRVSVKLKEILVWTHTSNMMSILPQLTNSQIPTFGESLKTKVRGPTISLRSITLGS